MALCHGHLAEYPIRRQRQVGRPAAEPAPRPHAPVERLFEFRLLVVRLANAPLHRGADERLDARLLDDPLAMGDHCLEQA